MVNEIHREVVDTADNTWVIVDVGSGSSDCGLINLLGDNVTLWLMHHVTATGR